MCRNGKCYKSNALEVGLDTVKEIMCGKGYGFQRGGERVGGRHHD